MGVAFFLLGLSANALGLLLLLNRTFRSKVVAYMVGGRMKFYDQVSESRFLKWWLFRGKNRDDAEKSEWDVNTMMLRYVFPVFLLIWGSICMASGTAWLLR
jgi:hypothetical protein